MGDMAGISERHRMLCNLPSNEEFKNGKLFEVMFDFTVKYLIKLYGTCKVRSSVIANPGCGMIVILLVNISRPAEYCSW